MTHHLPSPSLSVLSYIAPVLFFQKHYHNKLYKIMSLPMAVFTCIPHFPNFIFLLKHPCPLSAWIRPKYISLRFLFVQISMLGTKSLSAYRPPFRLSAFPGCPNMYPSLAGFSRFPFARDNISSFAQRYLP
jgi:hypothetical protein